MIFLRCAVVAFTAAAGLLLLRYAAPLQWPTVVFYTGVVIFVCGVTGMIRPPRWIGVSTRRDAAFAALGGMILLSVALLWPVETHRSDARNPIDALLPAYDFHEWHELRVHATPNRVAAAMREVTFADIGVMRSLMRIRNAVMGQFREPPPAAQKPILQMIQEGRTGFFPLLDTEREFIFGLAGQPWNSAARPVFLKPEQFASWSEPNHVKVAANLRVEDAGGGWSVLSTETRVQATDDPARRTMARYWRIIYPGSGLIRRSLLESIRQRAER